MYIDAIKCIYTLPDFQQADDGLDDCFKITAVMGWLRSVGSIKL